MKSRAIKVAVCLVVCVALGACESLNDKRKVDYKNSRVLPPLEVPPDLTSLPDANLPAASSAKLSEIGAERKPATTAAPNPASVLPQAPNLRIERDGQTRWLVVQDSPESLWPRVREFVSGAGFVVERENAVAGIIETDWVENRPRVGGGAQLFFTRWFNTLFSTGLRDRYRFRLERGNQPGVTEIYVAHQGMEEAVARPGATGEGEGTRWQPRPTEPDLEIEMMRQMIVYLGTTQDQASAVIAQTPAPPAERAQLARRGDNLALQLDDSLERAWRRVGLSLDRVGFTVEDRDRSKGIYYVRYLDPDKDAQRPGWVGRMFGAEDKKPEERYQIQLQAVDAGTSVVVKNESGAPELGKTGERILTLLYDQLK